MTYHTGDQFRVIGNHPDNKKLEGVIGVIVRQNQGRNNYSVRFRNGDYSDNWTEDNDMELLKEKFPSVGDQLVDRKNFEKFIITKIESDFKIVAYHEKRNQEYVISGLDSYIIKRNNLIFMQKIGPLMKRLLDSDSQVLVKAGLVNGNLELTETGKDAILTILFADKKSELVSLAKEIIEEEKSEK